MTEKSKFIEEFQNTHYRFLKEIYKAIENLYGNEDEQITKNILSEFQLSDSVIDSIKRSSRFNEELSLINLKNSWYHEVVMNYPYGANYIDERMKFLPWKIIQFYYSTYCSISSVVRCFDTKRNMGHDYIVNKFSEKIKESSEIGSTIIGLPFNIYILKNGKENLYKEKINANLYFCLQHVKDKINLRRIKKFEDINKNFSPKNITLFQNFKRMVELRGTFIIH